MKKRQNRFAHASALQISCIFGLLSIRLGECIAGPTPTPTATATIAPTPSPTPAPSSTPTPCANYGYTVSTGAIVPGTTDTGNHCDDCSSTVTVPFSYQLYDTSFNRVSVGSNGNLTFGARRRK